MGYPVFRIAAAALAAAALTAAPQAAGAVEILTNGGFEHIGDVTPESWGGLTYYAGGPFSMPGWTVASGSVDITTTGSFWGPAYEGQNSIDINGWSAGSLTQAFATVVGQTYNVSFAYSRNLGSAPYDALATVSAGGRVFDVSAPADGDFGSGYDMHWLTGSFSFVGNGSPTTLALTAVTGGNGGVFFDDISVQSIGEAVQGAHADVPEPAAWALMIGGFGMAGAMLRRRRAVAAAA